MNPTLVAWHRYGKEHGETDGFRVNPPEVIDAHIRDRVERSRCTDENQWKWYQISEDLIVERMFLGEISHEPRRTIYYLPKRLWVIQEHFHAPSLGPEWPWYVHIGSTTYDEGLQAWVFKDLFADIIIQNDQKTHSVLDLDELAQAHEIGLVDDTELRAILHSTQELVDLLRKGEFPPAELRDRERVIKELGWE